jgi:hypothetical protein
LIYDRCDEIVALEDDEESQDYTTCKGKGKRKATPANVTLAQAKTDGPKDSILSDCESDYDVPSDSDNSDLDDTDEIIFRL